MNIAKIVSIKSDGKPWDSNYGTMYPFYVVFDDGCAGSVNSKSETTAYKVGDMVGYEENGKTPKGVPKLKITRNPDLAKGTVTSRGPVDSSNPDLEAAPTRQATQKAQSQPLHTQTAPSGQIHAATACWAVGKAVELVIAGKENDVEATARHLLAIQQRIEQGETNVPF